MRVVTAADFWACLVLTMGSVGLLWVAFAAIARWQGNRRRRRETEAHFLAAMRLANGRWDDVPAEDRPDWPPARGASR